MLEHYLKPGGDREAIRCQTCGLVQYRTLRANCRRCLQVLVADAKVLVRASQQNPPTDNRQTFKESAIFAIVADIGERIRHLRVFSAMTQSQLRVRSRVSNNIYPRSK